MPSSTTPPGCTQERIPCADKIIDDQRRRTVRLEFSGDLPDARALLRLGRAMVALYCESFHQVPGRITLDIDDTVLVQVAAPPGLIAATIQTK
jgi:hypothetical protein